MATSAQPGWYDDGTGAQRWWDGTRWTDDYADFTGAGVALRRGADNTRVDDEFGGIVVDGRAIRCGPLSQAIGGVTAVVATAEEIGKRPGFVAASRNRALFSAAGAVKPRHFARLDRRSLHLAVESAAQVWLAPVHPGAEARAQRFAAWVNASADHYRYG